MTLRIAAEKNSALLCALGYKTFEQAFRELNNQKDFDDLYATPILISHRFARKDCLYQIVGLGSFAIASIWRGQPIGLMVEERPEHG